MSARKAKPLLHQVADRVFRDPTLSPIQKLIALNIGWHMNAALGEAWPSQKCIARETSMSEKAVQNNLKPLQQRTLLEVATGGSPSGGRRKSSRYRLATPEPGCTVQAKDHGTRFLGQVPRPRNDFPRTPEQDSQDPGTSFPLTNKGTVEGSSVGVEVSASSKSENSWTALAASVWSVSVGEPPKWFEADLRKLVTPARPPVIVLAALRCFVTGVNVSAATGVELLRAFRQDIGKWVAQSREKPVETYTGSYEQRRAKALRYGLELP